MRCVTTDRETFGAISLEQQDRKGLDFRCSVVVLDGVLSLRRRIAARGVTVHKVVRTGDARRVLRRVEKEV